MPRPTRRLALRPLEDRLAPANNLTLTDGPSVGVAFVTTGDQTVVRTTGPGAALNVADLAQALANPVVRQVTVSTEVDPAGTDGLQPGSITYDGSAASNLDLSAVGDGKTLLFRTAAGTNATGGITLNGVALGGPAAGPAGTWVKFDTSATNGDVLFGSGGVAFDGPAVGNLDVRTGAGAFTYADGGGAPDAARVGGWIMVQSGGAITLANRGGLDAGFILQVTGLSVQLGTNLTSVFDTVVHGDTTLTADVSLTATAPTGGASFAQPVNGHHTLTLSAAHSELFGDIGEVTPLAALIVRHGYTTFGINALVVGVIDQIVLGDGTGDGVPATLAAPVEIAADILVNRGGRLEPGEPGTPGTLQVSGDVTFAGGDLVLDLGPTSSLLHVLGDVTILGGNLGGGAGTGRLPGPDEVQVIKYTGTLTGQFDNAPVGAGVQVGGDAVRVTHYGPAATGMTIARVPAAFGGTYVGADADGTTFTARLTGGGELATAVDAAGGRFLVARGTTPSSRLTVTTRANASDDVAALSGLVVDGPLASFSGPKVDVANQFRVLGPARSIVLRDFTATGPTGLEIGGADTDSTALTARDLTGPVKLTGVLAALKARHLAGALTTAGVGTARLASVTGDVTTNGPVKAISMSGAFAGDLKASTLGSFAAGSVAGTVHVANGSSVVKSVTVAGDFNGTLAIPFGTFQTVAVGGTFAGSLTANHLVNFRAGSLAGDLTMADIPNFRAGVIDSMTVTGPAVGTLTARAFDKVKLGGGAFRLRGGEVHSLQVTGDAAAEIDALFVRAVTARGTLTGLAPWDIPFGVNSLSAGALAGLEVNTLFISTLSATGNRATGRPGDITDSAFHLSGLGAAVGIQTITATGTVRGTTFDIATGGVGTVTVGRFIDSDLFVGYTPAGAFNTGGTFASGGPGGVIQKFVTTAAPSADPTGPADWAFAGSRIAAPQIGTVRLSGLKTDNGGVAFGIRSQALPTSVQVKAADDPAVDLRTDLFADGFPAVSGLAGDFYLMAG